MRGTYPQALSTAYETLVCDCTHQNKELSSLETVCMDERTEELATIKKRCMYTLSHISQAQSMSCSSVITRLLIVPECSH